jgi:flagellar basal-body rod modification protein FlgD
VTIGSVSSTNTSTLSLTGSTTTTASSGSELTQADFLQLMTAQLQAQDPTSPMDNSQFASQLAQFSQLSATQDIDTNLQSLSTSLSSSMQASQVLSSANLVGRQVMVPSSTATYSGTAAVNGAVNVTNAGDIQVQVTDSTGTVVRTMDLGTQQAGLANFSWDGTDNSGTAVAAGTYSLSANNSGSTTALTTYVSAAVTGVGYGGSTTGTYLQVAGIGGVPLSQIAQIN